MLRSTKYTVFCKALESDAKLLHMMILLNTVWAEVQGVKAATKVELYFVSDNFWLFKQPKRMGTDDIIPHLRLSHSCHKTKADLWVPTGFLLTFTIWAKKCKIWVWMQDRNCGSAW